MQPPELAAVLQHFRIAGELTAAMPHGSGHINHSCRVSFVEHGVTCIATCCSG